jgi:hypothetical protein
MFSSEADSVGETTELKYRLIPVETFRTQVLLKGASLKITSMSCCCESYKISQKILATFFHRNLRHFDLKIWIQNVMSVTWENSHLCWNSTKLANDSASSPLLFSSLPIKMFPWKKFYGLSSVIYRTHLDPEKKSWLPLKLVEQLSRDTTSLM